MDFEEQMIAEADELLIEELQMLGVQAGGIVDKSPQTNNYVSIFNAKYSYLVQILKSNIIAHRVFEKIPQRQDCNNKIVTHKLIKKVH